MPDTSPRRKTILIALSVLAAVVLAGGGVLWATLSATDDTAMKIVVPDTHYTPLADPAPASSTTTTPPSSASPGPASTTTAPPSPPSTPKSGSKTKPATTPATRPATDSSTAGQMLALVNEERSKAGCGALSLDSRLTAAAQGHSDDMSARNYFSHTTPEGVTFDQRIESAGYPSPGAENIAKGATTVAQTMQLWMNSDGHRRNILNCSYRKLGVGLARAGWYWTQTFGF